MRVECAAVSVFIIDGDESVRRSLGRLMNSHGFPTSTYSTVEEFLGSADLKMPGCVISCVLYSSEGKAISQSLLARGLSIPIILLSPCDSEDLRAKARLAGVAAVFLKPVDDQALLDAIEWAMTDPVPGGRPAANPGG